MREKDFFLSPFTPMITPKKMNRSDSSTLPCIHLVLSFSLSHRCLSHLVHWNWDLNKDHIWVMVA